MPLPFAYELSDTDELPSPLGHDILDHGRFACVADNLRREARRTFAGRATSHGRDCHMAGDHQFRRGTGHGRSPYCRTAAFAPAPCGQFSPNAAVAHRTPANRMSPALVMSITKMVATQNCAISASRLIGRKKRGWPDEVEHTARTSPAGTTLVE